MKPRETWRAPEMEYLRQNYVKGNSEALAAHLGRSCTSVKCKLKRMGISEGNKPVRRKNWAETDLFMLRCLYPHTFPGVLAVLLNATADAVKLRAAKLGLKKSKGFYKYLRNKHNNEVWLCDRSIAVNAFQIKDKAAVTEFIEKYPELIELKRNELKVNGKLRELKRSAEKSGR
jgi:hypothetical protein